jgi:predicted ATPase
LGRSPRRRAHLAQGIALYDLQKGRTARTLLDPGVSCLGYESWTLWLLGYPDQALQRCHEALTLAQELAHPFSLACTLYYAAVLQQFSREVQAVQARAERLVALATEQEFPVFNAIGTMLRGWALATQGQGEAGTAQLHQGLAAYRAAWAEFQRTYWLTLLADAYRHTEQGTAGLVVLTETLVLVDTTAERFYEAEIYRLQGELLLTQVVSETQQAASCFRQALDIARHQQAKSLELRAATSLARLWQRQGKRDAARQVLAEVYGWFTEGFDTADLQEAKALLEELA